MGLHTDVFRNHDRRICKAHVAEGAAAKRMNGCSIQLAGTALAAQVRHVYSCQSVLELIY